MKHPLLCPTLAALALIACVAPASSQIIPENSFYAEDIPFIYDSNPEPVHQPQLAGLNLLNMPFHESGYVFDFCADFLNGNGELNDYNMSSGFGSLSSTQESEIRALMSNSLPTFVELLNAYIIANGGDWGENTGALAGDFNEVVGYAAGMQIALWEIVHEQSGQISINTDGPIAGSFGVETIPAAPPNPRGEIGRANAEDFLTAIRGGTWSDIGGIGYYYVNPVSPAEQDRLWLTQVPEPSAALLGVLGLLTVFRRRRG
ncbi:hypothetical protein [Haloferula sp. BvORR071]|uniref:hypothetical protein n=1 Tax=Haloferula sp. BvORR071 TaxID=1396141 RepID=UPI000559177E|nr:hypothetical protein [Haloferula sp. BvORR071]